MTEAACAQCGTHGHFHNVPSSWRWILDGTQFTTVPLASLNPLTFELHVHEKDVHGNFVPTADGNIATIKVQTMEDTAGGCGEGCSGSEPCVECSGDPETECDIKVNFEWDYDAVEAGATLYGLAVTERRKYDVTNCVGDPIQNEDNVTSTDDTFDVLQAPANGVLGSEDFILRKCGEMEVIVIALYDNTTWNPDDPHGPNNSRS